MNTNEEHIYSRQIVLDEIGIDGQQKLRDARVVIVGAGGLGCPAALYLAAAGIGHLTLIDGDAVDASNLPRQILYGVSDLNLPKATTAAAKLSALYPHLKVQSAPQYLTDQNAQTMLSNADIVLDCTDNFTARYLINDVCVQLGKPFVSGAIYKFEGQLALLNHQGGPTYRCLFPEFPKEKNHPNCADTGVLGVLPGIIGTLQATETIKWILGMSPLLDREMLLYDARTLETRKMKLPARNEIHYQNVRMQIVKAEKNTNTSPSIQWSELDTNATLQLVDVREIHELPEGPESTTHRIPWSSFEQGIKQLDPKIATVVYCQSGVRSEQAARLLKNAGFDAASISGGIQSLRQKENIV